MISWVHSTHLGNFAGNEGQELVTPVYHRFDVGWSRRGESFTVRASIYNLLNTENSMGVFGGGGFGGWQRQEGLFVLPFLRIEYRW